MGKKLKNALDLINEREEVYFAVLVLVLAAAFFAPLYSDTELLGGTEFVAACIGLYGVLVGGRAAKRKIGADFLVGGKGE